MSDSNTSEKPPCERRAQVDRREQAQRDIPTGWHLDKKVPLTLIFAMLMQGAMVIWAIADIKKDVELLKADATVLHQRDTQQSDSLRDAIGTLQSQYARMDAKLDRLIERSSK